MMDFLNFRFDIDYDIIQHKIDLLNYSLICYNGDVLA